MEPADADVVGEAGEGVVLVLVERYAEGGHGGVYVALGLGEVLPEQGVGLGLGDAVGVFAGLAARAVADGPAEGVLVSGLGKALLVLDEGDTGLAGAQRGGIIRGEGGNGEHKAGRENKAKRFLYHVFLLAAKVCCILAQVGKDFNFLASTGPKEQSGWGTWEVI